MSLGYVQPPGYFTPAPSGSQQLGVASAADAPVVVKEIPDGFPGTQVIVDEMRRHALEAYADERVNVLARQITIDCPRHDEWCEAATVLRWFQEQYRYTRLPFNPRGFQRLNTPSYTLFDSPVKTGECASLSTAMAAVLMSLGFEVMFVTAGQDPRDPLDFEHVYVKVMVPGHGWAYADPSYEEPLGWVHPNARTIMDWPL